MKIVLQFSAGASVLDRAIRWITWSDYNHVDGVVAIEGYGDYSETEVKLLGALPRGVCYHAPCKRYLRLDYRVAELPSGQGAGIIRFAKRQIGKPYDWLGLVGILLRCRRLHARNHSAWWCDRLWAEAFRLNGYALVDAPSWKLSPEDLLRSERLREATAIETRMLKNWLQIKREEP